MAAEQKSRNEQIHALLNRKRKAADPSSSAEKPDEPQEVASPSEPAKCPSEQDRMAERAKKKILLEAKLAKERADKVGPQGWLRPQSLNTNKEFLKRTLQATLRSAKK